VKVMEKIKNLLSALKSKKSLRWVLVGIVCFTVVAVYLLLLPTESGKEQTTETKASQDYASQTEAKLARALSEIKGVGKVTVAVSFEGTEELVIAYVESVQANGSTSKTPQLLSNGSKDVPLVLQTLRPKPLGAVVVAEGAGDVALRLRILEATCTFLGLSADCVNVYEG